MELQAAYKHRNRMMAAGGRMRQLPDCNIKLKYGHVTPLGMGELRERGKL